MTKNIKKLVDSKPIAASLLLLVLWYGINTLLSVLEIAVPFFEETEIGKRNAELAFELNHTMPMTERYMEILHELFGDRLGEGSFVMAPIKGVCFERVKIGKGVYINADCLMMARGGITIEDEAQLAANIQLITNNHDFYDRPVLPCKPILICKGAWVGAGVTILPGIRIGKHAVVGAASVVTKDVPDYAVAVGNPARVIKMLDADRFEGQE